MSAPMPQAGNSIAESLLSEFDHEMSNTRKALERVPEDKFGWKPHDKSGTMGWLATHLATMIGWGKMTLETESLDVNPPGGPQYQMPQPKTTAELLALFDKGREDFRAAIEKANDAEMLATWTLLAGGKVLFSMPRVGVIRGMILNHMVHHRGQLSVYLRLNDIPVPALYGPSADES